MAFQFPLATLLRVRTLREEREERMLQQILTEISQTLQLLREIDDGLRLLNDNRAVELRQAKGVDLQHRYGEVAHLQKNRAELRAHLEKLEDLKDKQLRIYASARQNREVLSELGDAHRDAYYSVLARRDQKMIDDVFNARHQRA